MKKMNCKRSLNYFFIKNWACVIMKELNHLISLNRRKRLDIILEDSGESLESNWI